MNLFVGHAALTYYSDSDPSCGAGRLDRWLWPASDPSGLSVHMWFERFSRLKIALRAMADDPHSQGKAAKVAGIALIADGFIGLENPLSGGSRRKGIFGALPLLLFGGAFLFFANITDNTAYEDGVIAVGRVVSVQPVGDGRSCELIVEYQAAGETLRTGSGMSSSTWCDDLGRSVDVSYRPGSPGSARVLEDGASVFVLFKVFGWVIVASAAALLLLRLAEIIAGVGLWLWGRRQVRKHPPTPESDWMTILRQAWTGGMNEGTHNGGTSTESLLGQIGGAISRASGNVLQNSTSSSPPPPGAQPLTPPAGWYQDPSSPSGRRWWDGKSWTSHT